MTIAYLVVETDCGNGYETKRVYLDRAEAEAFVEAYNAATYADLEIEEIEIGAPAAEYDGPVWFGTWTTRRKLKGEKQLVMVADGFTIVVPSAVPGRGSFSYYETFGPSWRDLAKVQPEYEEPPVWIDNFHYRQEWHTGNDPTSATVVPRAVPNEVTVWGTSKDEVEALLRSTALQMKAVQ